MPRTGALRTEDEVRRDLAAAYRLAALAGWDDSIYTHLSAAVPGEAGHYLLNVFGLGFDEVEGSNLVKVNLKGEVVDGSGTPVNPTGFTIHATVHEARPDVECVIHLHSPWGVALSMIPEGLLHVSQWAMRLHGRLGRHTYEGLALGALERQRMVLSLAGLDGLILENHGTLVVGRTVAEAYMFMHILERAAQAQLRAMAAIGGCVPSVSGEVARIAKTLGSTVPGLPGLNRKETEDMPTIRVELFEGRSQPQKAALAARLTQACVEVLGGSPASVDVIFYDVARQDWATGGVLWSQHELPKPAE